MSPILLEQVTTRHKACSYLQNQIGFFFTTKNILIFNSSHDFQLCPEKQGTAMEPTKTLGNSKKPNALDEQHLLDELFKLVSPEKLGEWLEVLVIRLAKLRPPFNI